MAECVAYAEVYDPRTHRLQNPTLYTAWDLYHLSKADIVLAYMEKGEHPAYGLVLEVGVARGLRKLIVLVDERTPEDRSGAFARHFAIVRESADIVLEDMRDALTFLASFKTP